MDDIENPAIGKVAREYRRERDTHDPFGPEGGSFGDFYIPPERRDVPLGTSMRVIDPTRWEGKPVPEREWIVPECVPAAAVTILAGEGAAGKSTLALQLAVARGVSKAWLNTMPKPGRTLVLSAEDDADELHRRLDAIRQHYEVSFADLADLHLVDLVGEDAVLGLLARNGVIQAAPLFGTVEAEIERFRPDLVIVDALADVFAGDENNRSQARQFISLLRRPARQFGCAFLCLAHPSLTGINSGTGASGSTAWGNSVRSRLFFEKAKASDGTEPDPNLRTLTVNKSNYGPAGNTITVKWSNGVYVPVTGSSSLDKRALENRADETFLDLLRAFNMQGQEVSPKPSSSYAPKLFAEHHASNGIGPKQFTAAMQRHLSAGKIRIETIGPPSRRRSSLVIAEAASN